MTRLCLLFIMAIGLANDAETELDPKITRGMESFSETSIEVNEEADEAIAEIEAERSEDLLKARDKAIRDLQRLIRRSSDFTFHADIHKQVLRLNPQDETALQFFSSIGTLDTVLANLEPLLEEDLLGKVQSSEALSNALPPNIIVQVFTEKGFAGTSADFAKPGTFDQNNLQVGNDRIKSMKIRPGFEVELFLHGKLAHSLGVFTGEIPETNSGIIGMVIRKQ